MAITSFKSGLLIFLYKGLSDHGDEVLMTALLGRDNQGEVLALCSGLSPHFSASNISFRKCSLGLATSGHI